MKIILNGEDFDSSGAETVAQLLELKNIHGGRIAVMINDAIIKKDRYGDTAISEGDRVEVIHMVGGG